MRIFLNTLFLILCSLNRAFSHENTLSIDDTNSLELDKINENIGVRSAIANYQTLTSLFFKRGLKLNPDDEVANRLVDDMIVALKDIIDLVRTEKHAQQFVKMQGFQKVVAPMFTIKRADMKTLLLTLTRDLFLQCTDAMSDIVPVKYVDSLIDTMEYDNGGNRAVCLDILTRWLPGQVDAQTRVIRYKGLRPFYQILTDLQPESLKALLELFNRIIKEHKTALDKETELDEALVEKYQRMGLLQMVGHRESCYALLEIFEKSPTMEQEDILVVIYQLLVETRALCADYYRAHPRVAAVCKALLEQFSDAKRQERLEKALNVTDAIIVLNGCVQLRDEF